MRRVMRTGSLGLVLAAIALGGSLGLAQNVEQEKLVFEHIIPNIEGKSMVAVVVTYPPAGKSPAPFAARLAMSPQKSTRWAKASTRCPAPPNVKPSPAAKPQQQVTRVAARSILMLA
jgi:hypothetical protein